MSEQRVCVGVDFDDTIMPFVKSFVEFCTEDGLSPQPVHEIKILRFDVILACTVPFANNVFERFAKSAHWESMHNTPPTPECKEALALLKEQGVELHIVTARDTRFKDITLEYLDKHLPGLFTDYHFGNVSVGHPKRSKVEMCKSAKVSILVDDNWDNVDDVHLNGIVGIPFGTESWIKEHPRNHPTWSHVTQTILATLNKQ